METNVVKVMSGGLQHVGVTSLIFIIDRSLKQLSIIDCNILPFQKKCRNKDYSQKLVAAIVMAQKAEQISIGVRECSDHILAFIWDLDAKPYSPLHSIVVTFFSETRFP